MIPDITKMSLREKIGQTAIPAPNSLEDGRKAYGCYEQYLKKYPYSGIYIGRFRSDDGEIISETKAFANFIKGLQPKMPIPLFVTCDGEFGIRGWMFDDGHTITPQIGVAAANDEELAYKRGLYWGRELSSLGINWPFSPVGDLAKSFFSSHSVRCFSDDSEKAGRMFAATIKGLQQNGIAACAKHFPSGGHDFRDAHFSFCVIDDTLDEWSNGQKKVWEAAKKAGVKTFMIGHPAMPCVDPVPVKHRIPRPSSASSKVIDILRKDIGHEGVIVSDAVSMKSLAASFSHDDIYIECFNAGNDIVLFCHDDYFDVMEKAVKCGRVSLERLDESVERILRLKDELGLFDGKFIGAPMTEQETSDFEKVIFELSSKSLTLVSNSDGAVPFDKNSVKKVSVIAITEYRPFIDRLEALKSAFEAYGINCAIYDGLNSKRELEHICDESEIVIYACYICNNRPFGFPGFSSPKSINTLFHSFSHGFEKSVAVSFGSTTVYYNYFEYANAYIDAYSDSPETMKAVAMALLGDIPFKGVPPMKLHP